jgi:hypothetical protein
LFVRLRIPRETADARRLFPSGVPAGMRAGRAIISIKKKDFIPVFLYSVTESR